MIRMNDKHIDRFNNSRNNMEEIPKWEELSTHDSIKDLDCLIGTIIPFAGECTSHPMLP